MNYEAMTETLAIMYFSNAIVLLQIIENRDLKSAVSEQTRAMVDKFDEFGFFDSDEKKEFKDQIIDAL